MAFWNKFPYTDSHELNLDWILKKTALIEKNVKDTFDALKDAIKAKEDAEDAKDLAEAAAIAAERAKDVATDVAERLPYTTQTIIVNDSIGYITKISKAYQLKGFNSNNGVIPSEYAETHNKMLVFNASYAHETMPYGTVVQNGEEWQGETYSGDASTADTLGITETGEFKFYPISTPASTMINDNVYNSFTAWGKLIVNGVQVKFGDTVNPLQAIGDDTNFYYFISINGRTAENPGASYNDLAQLGINYNLNNLFVLDGGGSLSSVANGVRYTDKIDDSGLTERKVYSIIYFDYPEFYRENSGINGQINVPENLSNMALSLEYNSNQDILPRMEYKYDDTLKIITQGLLPYHRIEHTVVDTSGDVVSRTQLGFTGIREITDLTNTHKNAQVYSVSGGSSPTGTQGFLINLPFAYATTVCIQLFLPQGQRQILRRTIDSSGTESAWESLGGTVFSNSAPTSQPYLFNGSQWFDTTNKVMKFYYNGTWY